MILKLILLLDSSTEAPKMSCYKVERGETERLSILCIRSKGAMELERTG